MKPINSAHINIFHKNECWFKIWMEFLRPLLAKIKLICQQLTMPQLSGVEGVASQPWGAGYDGWGLMGWSGYDCWADVANHVTWLWQAGDTKNFERRITG